MEAQSKQGSNQYPIIKRTYAKDQLMILLLTGIILEIILLPL